MRTSLLRDCLLYTSVRPSSHSENNVSFQNVKTGEPLSQKEIDEMFMRRCLQPVSYTHLLVEQLYVFLLDIASLQSLCHYVLIVGQSKVEVDKLPLDEVRQTALKCLSLIHI